MTIELESVSKRFDDEWGLRDVTFSVDPGEIYVLLGPNGAGKSTLIDILLDFHKPDAGTIRVCGYDPQSDVVEVHSRIGVVPQGYDVFPRLTAKQHVAYAIDAKQATDDPEAILERVGLADDALRDVEDFSHGMKHRLVLAMAIVGQPDVLILDEPFNGIDHNGVQLIRSILSEERQRGAAVFLSNHDLTTASAIASKIGILNEGILVDSGTVTEVCSRSPLERVYTFPWNDGIDHGAIGDIEGVTGIDRDENELVVRAKHDKIETQLRSAGIEPTSIETSEPTLEAVFSYYTKDRGPREL